MISEGTPFALIRKISETHHPHCKLIQMACSTARPGRVFLFLLRNLWMSHQPTLVFDNAADVHDGFSWTG
jgi:hypothetical protein